MRARGAPAILVRMNAKPLAVGIDASTQGVKALALGPDGPEALAAVNFAKDLPRFGAPEGFADGAANGTPARRSVSSVAG